VSFPDIDQFPDSHPGPYERQMGNYIAGLLSLFRGRVPDPESNHRVLELASSPARWSAGHALFDEVRKRLLADGKDKVDGRSTQYCFEESCLQALYNATDPPDPFDPGSPFFVAGQALGLARAIGIPVEAVVTVLAPGG
jgi:hypothetical protein